MYKITDSRIIATQESVCKSCNLGEHSLKSHSMWIEDEDDIRTIACKCDKCLSQ